MNQAQEYFDQARYKNSYCFSLIKNLLNVAKVFYSFSYVKKTKQF